MRRAWAALCLAASPALGQQGGAVLEPSFTIWDVELGASVETLPEEDVIEISCGTGGGPRGAPLASFDDFRDCPPEGSGLHEVHFAYDDEMAYVARALDLEYDVLRAGTSVYAHDVMLSVLIDGEGVIQGIRILTDPRVPQRERRRAVTLIRNLEARYGDWGLECQELPLADGEMPVGDSFVKRTCAGTDPAGTMAVRLDARYLRKQGQVAVIRETQEVTGYFEAFSRLELVRLPYQPSPPPVLE